MTKFYLFILVILFSSISAFSQESPLQKEQKLREYKMQFLAQEMELKDNQKEKFYTLYQEMSDKVRESFRNAEELKKQLNDNPDASEEDYQKVREAERNAADQAKEIEKEYDKKFSEFLTQKQLYKLKEAEKQFRKRMQEMKLSHHGKKNPDAKGNKEFKRHK